MVVLTGGQDRKFSIHLLDFSRYVVDINLHGSKVILVVSMVVVVLVILVHGMKQPTRVVTLL